MRTIGVWGEKSFMGKTYDGIHRISFLIDADGKIEHVFDDFKTSNHHDVVSKPAERTRLITLLHSVLAALAASIPHFS
ncbi:hypothetical protein ACLB1T_03045 [Escherichia coli]